LGVQVGPSLFRMTDLCKLGYHIPDNTQQI
jgi:hypothetical protein